MDQQANFKRWAVEMKKLSRENRTASENILKLLGGIEDMTKVLIKECRSKDYDNAIKSVLVIQDFAGKAKRYI